MCQNNVGSYSCTCNAGYKKNGHSCEGILSNLLYKISIKYLDIDECTDGVDDCDINGECTNTIGSFACNCKSGYSGDGTECQSRYMQH